LLALEPQFDSDDGRILLWLGELWLGFLKQRDGHGAIAKRIRTTARVLRQDHLALEAQVTVGHWYVRHQRADRDRHAKELFMHVYTHSVAQSYPFFMISTQILRQYHALRMGLPVNLDELEQAAGLADAHGMRGLLAQAVYVQTLIEPMGETVKRAEALAVELNFAALPALFPQQPSG
jgi:hypothetical protein